MYKTDILHQTYCIFILKLNKNMNKNMASSLPYVETYGVELTMHRNVGVEPLASKRPASLLISFYSVKQKAIS